MLCGIGIIDTGFGLDHVLRISLICAGVYVSCSQGMVFGFATTWAQDRWWCKPLFTCLPCMASAWSILIAWEVNIPLMLAVCGLNACIAALLQFFDAAKLPEG